MITAAQTQSDKCMYSSSTVQDSLNCINVSLNWHTSTKNIHSNSGLECLVCGEIFGVGSNPFSLLS